MTCERSDPVIYPRIADGILRLSDDGAGTTRAKPAFSETVHAGTLQE
jgi:hypothetical protein